MDLNGPRVDPKWAQLSIVFGEEVSDKNAMATLLGKVNAYEWQFVCLFVFLPRWNPPITTLG